MVRDHFEIESRRACPELVERGRLNFRPVQIRFERCLGSATALSLQRPSPFCHPERTRISYLTALTGATYVVLPKENHIQLAEATSLDRKSGGADLSRRAVEGSAVPRTSPGNAEYYAQTELSSRLPRRAVGPERTRISCHAALDKTACAPFLKERRMMFANATNIHWKFRGSVAERSAVFFYFSRRL